MIIATLVTNWKRLSLFACMAFLVSPTVAWALLPITFQPSNPSPGQQVTAQMSSISICGNSSVSIAGTIISIETTPPGPCITDGTLAVSLGAFPAGTYQVTWAAGTDVVPNPNGPFAAGTLVVSETSAAPALSLWATMCLVAVTALGGALHFLRRCGQLR